MTGYIGRDRNGLLVADVPYVPDALRVDKVRTAIQIDGISAYVTGLGKVYDDITGKRRYLYLEEPTAVGLLPRHNRPVTWSKPPRLLPDGVRKSVI